MSKFAQFALVLEGLASFAAGLYFLNEGRAGAGIVLLILGLFSTVAVLATGASVQDPLVRDAMDCDVCRHVAPDGLCSCPAEPPVRR